MWPHHQRSIDDVRAILDHIGVFGTTGERLSVKATGVGSLSLSSRKWK